MRFSNFIRAPGTAGPPTREGIRNLGFAFITDFPTQLSKYLRVDAAQSFSGPEKTQGRSNLGVIIGTDVQAYDAGLASIAALVTAADRMIYTTALDTYAVTPLTAFGRSLVDDADAATARATLVLGNVNNTSDANKPVSTAQQTALNLKADLASPPLTGVPTAPTAAPGTNTTQLASTAFVGAAVAAVSTVFVSAQQTISTSGLVTVAHGLGAQPKRVDVDLVNITTENGWVAGDRLYNVSQNQVISGTNIINSWYADATNVYIRFSNNANCFYTGSKSAGNPAAAANANWRVVIKASI